jgi:anaerobic nitric oxide reductase transcription regulator
VQRVGADRALRVDVRIVAATNRNLVAEVEAGRFRADLYHRLAAYPLVVPRSGPARGSAGPGRPPARLAPAAVGRSRGDAARGGLALLREYPWPGNVRELDNVLGRALLRAVRDGRRRGRVEIGAEHLRLDLPVAPASGGRASAPVTGGTLAEQVEEFRRRRITEAVAIHDGNWAAAARSLGLHRANLHALAKRLGLKS